MDGSQDRTREAREQELDEKITAMLRDCDETIARLRNAVRALAQAWG